MKDVILTVGPRAAGKSTFCKRAILFDPSIVLVSRDAILVELFGTTSLDPYSGGHQYGSVKMWELVEWHLHDAPRIRLLLDAWNGSFHERREMIRKLRWLGADTVTAWYFETPANIVGEWFWKKPDITRSFFSEDAPRRDHELFHQLAVDIENDGFDAVIRIADPVAADPQQILGA